MRNQSTLQPTNERDETVSSKRRKIKLPPFSRINYRIVDELDALICAVPARRLSRNLRNIYLHYISLEQDALLGPYASMPEDLYFLLQLLDVIDDELRVQKQ